MFPKRFCASVLCVVVMTACGRSEPAPPSTPAATTPGAPTPGGTPNASAAPALPSYWFESDFDAWNGKRWQDIDLFQFIKGTPSGLDSGTRYVVFYGRTCDHCEMMFNEDLSTNEDLASRVTAVEVPAEQDRLRGDNPWPMPATKCAHAELPIGPNWIMTTPITVRLENGIVRCAQEGEHKRCMGLE